jgi:hypothetical protein
VNIKFSDLSTSLKVLVVMGWIYVSWITFFLLVGMIAGIVEAIL